MIHVIAAIRAQEGQRDTLLKAFQEILTKVRAKAGCIEYSLAVHLMSGFPGQPAIDENELIIIEKWSDLDALKRHITDPIYQAWFVELWQYVAGASMQVFEAVDCESEATWFDAANVDTTNTRRLDEMAETPADATKHIVVECTEGDKELAQQAGAEGFRPGQAPLKVVTGNQTTTCLNFELKPGAIVAYPGSTVIFVCG